MFLVAFALGLLGAILAVSLEWFMVVFGVGILRRRIFIDEYIPPGDVGQEPYAWLIFVVGGIVGMCLMVIIFDWTLIMISSLLGAILIVHAFHGTEGFRELLFVSTMVTGIAVQYLTLRGTPYQEPLQGAPRQYAQSGKEV